MTCAIYSSLFWSFNVALSRATHFAHPKRSPYRQDGFQNRDKVCTKTGIHHLSRWNEIITSSWLINLMVYNHSLKSPGPKINKWLSYLAKTLLFQQKVFHTRSTSWSSLHNLSSWCIQLVDVTYKVTKIAVTWLAYSYSKRHMHNEPTIGNQCGHYACQRRPASTQRVNLLGWGKILSVKNVTTKWKRVYPSPRSQALKWLSRMWPLSKLQLLRGTQRRFPPKYPENTF